MLRARIAIASAIAFLGAIIAAHFALIWNAEWQSDDYFRLWHDRSFGWPGFWASIRWGPRPVSEAILALYYLWFSVAGRSALHAFLAVLWAVSFGVALTIAASRKPNAPGIDDANARLARVLFCASVIALSLLVSHPGDMFYSAFPAAAYLTNECAILALLLVEASAAPGDRRARLFRLAALVVIAWCSELGALFALAYTGFLVVAKEAAPSRGPSAAGRSLDNSAQRFASFAIPVAAAAAVLVATHYGRMAAVSLFAPNQVHSWTASLTSALPRFASDICGFGSPSPNAAEIVKGLAVKLLFFLGVAASAVVPDMGVPERRAYEVRLLGFAIALLLTAYFGAVLAYYVSGGTCCELRHQAFRQCLVIMAIGAAAFAARASVWIPLVRLTSGGSGTGSFLATRRAIGAALLVSAATVPLWHRAGDLAQDYAVRPSIAKVVDANWRSGLDPSQQTMTFINPPLNRVADNYTFAPGVYRKDQNPTWNVLAVLLYFGKKTLLVPEASPDR